MLKLLAASATAFALVCSMPVAAQDVCDDAEVILSLGQTILEKRPELPRLQARRFGAHALYLMMRYGDVDDATVERELAAMLADGVPLARDLAFAWSYGMSDGTKDRLLGPDAVASVLTATTSGARAMIREGDIDPMMSVLAGMNDPVGAFPGVVIAALDYTDGQKAALADAAMAHDLPILAAGFMATHQKTKAWPVFVATLDAETAERALQAWFFLPTAMGNPMLPRKTDQSEPGPYGFTTAKLNEIAVAAMKIPQNDFLNTLLNQSAEVDKVVAAATAIEEAAAAGGFERRGTLDEAWLLAYRTLAEQWDDPEQLEGQLASFDLDTGRNMSSDRTLGILDRIVAIDALTPFLRSEVDEPPAMPALLSPNAEAAWPQWLEIAAAVKANPSDPAHIGEDTMAAEMLFAAGKTRELASMVAEAPASLQLLRLATDMAIRLDRGCESYLWHPGESLMLAGTPIFKFDGRDNQ